jgi:hypothetical protein
VPVDDPLRVGARLRRGRWPFRSSQPTASAAQQQPMFSAAT